MKDKNVLKPFTFEVNVKDEIIPNYDNYIVRKLSSMKGQYIDTQAYNELKKKRMYCFMKFMKNYHPRFLVN